MPDSLVIRDGALVLTPGGDGLVTSAAGAPCCCAPVPPCSKYFRAIPCGDSHPCPLVVPDIYVCADHFCFATVPPSQWQGMILQYPSGCWAVDVSVSYTELPPNGVVAPDGATCRLPGQCHLCPPRKGYYQAVLCGCSNGPPGTPVAINAVIDCVSEWTNRRNGIRCPTYAATNHAGTGHACVQAAIWLEPIQPGPGMEILAGTAVDGCCRCCIQQCEPTDGLGSYTVSNGPGQFPTTTTFPIQCCCGHWQATWSERRLTYQMVNGQECLLEDFRVTASMSSEQPFEERCYTVTRITYDCTFGGPPITDSFSVCGHNCEQARGSALGQGLPFDFGSLRRDCNGSQGSGGQNYLPGGIGFRVDWSINNRMTVSKGPCRGTCEESAPFRPPPIGPGPIGPGGPINPQSILPGGCSSCGGGDGGMLI
jgi:hypothetical protein